MPLKENTAYADILFDCSTPNSYLRHKTQKVCGRINDPTMLKPNVTTTCQVSFSKYLKQIIWLTF